MRMTKIGIIAVALLLAFAAATAIAQLVINPPVPDIHINGHTYNNAQLQANPAGYIAGIANDIGLITAQYPQGRFSPRVVLNTDITMYVNGSGSDANNCLVNNACQTIQATYNKLRDGYDLAGHAVTIHLDPGSYVGLIDSFQLVGQTAVNHLVISGDSNSVGATIINGSQSAEGDIPVVMEASYSGNFEVKWVTIQTNDPNAHGLYAYRGGMMRYSGIKFGPVTGCQTLANQRGELETTVANTVSGGGYGHYCASAEGANMACTSVTSCGMTVSGNPNFSGAFAVANTLGLIYAPNVSLSGSTTGWRYNVDSNAVIITGGSGVNYFPGSVAGCGGGACASGGQYL